MSPSRATVIFIIRRQTAIVGMAHRYRHQIARAGNIGMGKDQVAIVDVHIGRSRTTSAHRFILPPALHTGMADVVDNQTRVIRGMTVCCLPVDMLVGNINAPCITDRNTKVLLVILTIQMVPFLTKLRNIEILIVLLHFANVRQDRRIDGRFICIKAQAIPAYVVVSCLIPHFLDLMTGKISIALTVIGRQLNISRQHRIRSIKLYQLVKSNQRNEFFTAVITATKNSILSDYDILLTGTNEAVCNSGFVLVISAGNRVNGDWVDSLLHEFR